MQFLLMFQQPPFSLQHVLEIMTKWHGIKFEKMAYENNMHMKEALKREYTQ